jgi:hypothetical protein
MKNDDFLESACDLFREGYESQGRVQRTLLEEKAKENPERATENTLEKTCRPAGTLLIAIHTRGSLRFTPGHFLFVPSALS